MHELIFRLFGWSSGPTTFLSQKLSFFHYLHKNSLFSKYFLRLGNPGSRYFYLRSQIWLKIYLRSRSVFIICTQILCDCFANIWHQLRVECLNFAPRLFSNWSPPWKSSSALKYLSTLFSVLSSSFSIFLNNSMALKLFYWYPCFPPGLFVSNMRRFKSSF